ncbi:hypothetical protein RvY_11739 [Ramazzottius varieornatus]|uniref:Uncharacterized protein n=1 Tax=Ramazzottius varieornatus TaxID=947166 RepID=A0A1D1VH63_RAMVA|nr:hypothetical protein RvY_11739 [Ramazzottius varieornatus]
MYLIYSSVDYQNCYPGEQRYKWFEQCFHGEDEQDRIAQQFDTYKLVIKRERCLACSANIKIL